MRTIMFQILVDVRDQVEYSVFSPRVIRDSVLREVWKNVRSPIFICHDHAWKVREHIKEYLSAKS